MEIQVPGRPVVVPGPDVIFSFEDNGGANTRVLIAIDEIATVQNNAGPQSKVVLPIGKTYRCGIAIMALKHMSLNARFNIRIKADDITVGYAKGDIPNDQPSEWGKAFFDLTVQ